MSLRKLRANPDPRTTASTQHAAAARTSGSPIAEVGETIRIRGNVTGDEDLLVAGHVEGRIEIHGHRVTIGPSGKVKADVSAREVVVYGSVAGHIVASERVEIGSSAHVEGDISTPSIVIEDGAVLNGKVSMKASGAAKRLAPVNNTAAANSQGSATDETGEPAQGASR